MCLEPEGLSNPVATCAKFAPNPQVGNLHPCSASILQHVIGPVSLKHPALALLLAVVFTLASHTPWAETPLPDLGGAESTVLSPAQEQALQGQILRQIRATLPVLDDAEVSAYIRAIGNRLLASAPDARGRFRFVVLKDPAINAFAAPGGVIAVNSGLILSSHDESELAGVMAHEISHVTQRHLARSYAREGGLSLKTGLALLAGLIIGAYNPDAGAAAALSGMAASQQERLTYSRQNEQEADRIGVKVMANAGYDPTGMPRFFHTLARQSGQQGGKLIEYLQTHPLTQSRLADTEARARQLASGHRLETDRPEFAYLKARVRVLTGNAAERAERLATLARKRTLTPLESYEYGLALVASNKASRAIAPLRHALESGAPSMPVRLALAEALLEAGKAERAERILERLRSLHPTSPAVRRLLARTLMERGKNDKALELLFAGMSRDDADPEDLRLLSVAAGRLHRRALAREAMAERYFALGRYDEALQQIRLALQEEDADEVTRGRLLRKRAQLQTWLSSEQE